MHEASPSQSVPLHAKTIDAPAEGEYPLLQAYVHVAPAAVPPLQTVCVLFAGAARRISAGMQTEVARRT